MSLPKRTHKLTKRVRIIEEVEAHFPGLKAFIDATKQKIPGRRTWGRGRPTTQERGSTP